MFETKSNNGYVTNAPVPKTELVDCSQWDVEAQAWRNKTVMSFHPSTIHDEKAEYTRPIHRILSVIKLFFEPSHLMSPVSFWGAELSPFHLTAGHSHLYIFYRLMTAKVTSP